MNTWRTQFSANPFYALIGYSNSILQTFSYKGYLQINYSVTLFSQTRPVTITLQHNSCSPNGTPFYNQQPQLLRDFSVANINFFTICNLIHTLYFTVTYNQIHIGFVTQFTLVTDNIMHYRTITKKTCSSWHFASE